MPEGGSAVKQSSSGSLWPLVTRELRSGIGVPLAACTSVVLVLLMNLTPLVANDFWTQIKVGELIRETGQIPDTVLFAFGDAGDFTFVAYEWLPSLGFSLIHSAAGMGGVIGLRALVALLVFALLVLLSLQINRDLLLSLFIAMASFLVISCRLYIRPELFAFVFGLAELNLLQAFVRSNDRRWLVALIPLTVLWANCHGSFPVAIALPLIFAAGALADEFVLRRWHFEDSTTSPDRRAWVPFLAVGVGMAVASLINPFGWDLIEKVLTLAESDYIRADISEWKSVFAAEAFFGSREFVFYILYLVLVADSLVQRAPRGPARIYVLSAVFLVLSLDANRHVAWFGVAGACVLAHALEGAHRLSERRERTAFSLAAVQLIGCVATFSFGNPIHMTPGLNDRSPLGAQAIEFIRGSGYSGNVFNAYVYGGKLAYHFYPDVRIAIDDRIDAYGEDYYRNFQRFDGQHARLLAAPDEFLDYFERNELNLVVVGANALNVWRASGRLAALEKAGWRVVFRGRGSGPRILRRIPRAPG